MRRWNWACDSLPCIRWVLARWAWPGGIPAKAWLRVAWSSAIFFSNVFTTEAYFLQLSGSFSILFNLEAKFSQTAKDLLSSVSRAKQGRRRMDETKWNNEKPKDSLFGWCVRIHDSLSSSNGSASLAETTPEFPPNNQHRSTFPTLGAREQPAKDACQQPKQRKKEGLTNIESKVFIISSRHAAGTLKRLLAHG